MTPAALDPAALFALRDMADGDDAFLAELVDTFLADVPDLLTAMVAAARSDDAAGLRRAAHTLKSNLRTFGAAVLAERCRLLEELAAAGATDGAAALVAEVEAGYPSVATALRALAVGGFASAAGPGSTAGQEDPEGTPP